MGGVHATMVASLYPAPLALTPLLAPRSAAGAYCAGALYYATAWDKLVHDSQAREAQIVAAVEATARANARLAAARVGGAGGREVGEAPGGGGAEGALAAARRAPAMCPATLPPPPGGEPAARQASFSPISTGQAAASTAWSGLGSWLSEQASASAALVQQVRRLEGQGAAVALLEAVLEAYTDSTRFPRPQRPDAAVLVAATEDAYVSRQSVEELARHLPGCEVRWVPGGHVSSFLMHQPAFRKAIVDSLARL
jgi:pimeloyl-ACP methyl ester carboxylesterase